MRRSRRIPGGSATPSLRTAEVGGTGAGGRWSWSGIRIEVTGDARALRHLTAEFGTPLTANPDSSVDLRIRFGSTSGATGRHKGTWWRVEVAAPAGGGPVDAAIEVHGPFGQPLIQSILVEQLIGLVAAGRGVVLIPAAGLVTPDGRAMALVGGAGAGKTAATLAALAAGWTVLSDDHLLIDATGTVRGLPRRMRIHDSTLAVVPGSRGAMTPDERAGQARLAALARFTLGHVRLPNLVAAARFGSYRPAEPVHLESLVTLQRRAAVGPDATARTPADMMELLAADIAGERADLVEVLGPAWDAYIAGVIDAERALLLSALKGLRLASLTVPKAWPPARTLDHLAADPLVPMAP
jgi:hypothetical protein